MALPDPVPRPEEARKLNFERAFTRLCHILPLAREGKASEALDELVLTVLVTDDSDEHRTPAAVAGALDALFGVSLPVDDVEASLERACGRGSLERTSGGGCRPTPTRRASILERIEEGEDLEESVRDGWIAELIEAGAADDGEYGESLWRVLQGYMTVVFARHGALAMELLDPSAPSSGEDSASLTDTLTSVLAEEGIDTPGAAQAIEQFFDHPSAERSRYIAQLLDATFTFFALTADEQVASLVQGQLPPLHVFVDTNFVFALVGIDECPESDLARELVRVINDNGLPFRLYYHEKTEKEMSRTLEALKSRLTRRKWPAHISRAAIETKSVWGLEMTYHRLNAEEGPIDPKIFMERWDHIGQQLKEEWGIEIYRSSGRDEYEVEEKGHLIAEYRHFVEQQGRDGEPKRYEAADHDISVWLSVSSRRDRTAKSTLHAGAIFLTLDRLFQRFDDRELRKGGPRSVVQPGQLLQVLRPLTRRREDFDTRFASAVAAVEFRTMPGDYEETRPSILSYLASYKDMPKETALKVLSDEILAHRVRELEEDSDEFREAIESKVVQINAELRDEHNAMEEELAEERSRLEEAERARRERDEAHRAELTSVREDLTATQSALEEERQVRAEEQKAREEKARAQRETEEQQADAVTQLTDEVQTAREEQTKFRTNVRRAVAVTVWLLALGGGLLASAVTDWTWLDDHDKRVAIHIQSALVWSGVMGTAAFPRLRTWSFFTVLAAAFLALVGYL